MKKRFQVAFDVPEELRNEIKARAAIRGISMHLWLLRAIYMRMKQEGDLIKPPSETE